MVKITEIAKQFNIDEEFVHKTILVHGNYITQKLLHHTRDGYLVSKNIQNEITETRDRLTNMIIEERDILRTADTCIPFAFSPRIYFLLQGDVIVYVGQSKILCGRIVQHIEGGKEFDLVSTFPIKQDILTITEFMNIMFYQPVYNKDVVIKERFFKEVLKHSCFF